jgi:hypothetical protein
MQYRIVLKDSNEKSFRLFGWFLCFLHLIAAGISALNASTNYDLVVNCIFSCFYVLFILIYVLLGKKFSVFLRFRYFLYAWYIIFWITQPVYLAIPLLLLIIGFSENVRSRKTSINFDDESIAYKQVLFSKVWKWQELENVVLKDGLLTLDFKNNHLLQVEPVAANGLGDVPGFNNFCQSRLHPAT